MPLTVETRQVEVVGHSIMGVALPVMKGQEVVRVFESLGWVVVRQTGSHIIMTKDAELVTLSIPDHREVAKGTFGA